MCVWICLVFQSISQISIPGSICICICMYIYVYVCICMYMYVYVCIYMYMYMYVYVCICMYMYVYVCICMYIYVYVYVCVCICMYVYVCVCVCVCLCLCICICICMCMYMCMSMSMYMYMYMYRYRYRYRLLDMWWHVKISDAPWYWIFDRMGSFQCSWASGEGVMMDQPLLLEVHFASDRCCVVPGSPNWAIRSGALPWDDRMTAMGLRNMQKYHSYWKLPFIVDFPIKNVEFP